MKSNKKRKIELKVCGRCKKEVPLVHVLDATTQAKLTQKGHSSLAGGQYCRNCVVYVMNEAYSTVLEKRVRIESDKRQAELWLSRVPYLKQGKQAFQERKYLESVSSYLSYLKIIETVLGISEGGLRPEHFRTIKGEKEKSVVSSVYFDLMRIYDQDTKTYNKFQDVVNKLLLFIPNNIEGRKLTKAVNRYSKSKEAKHHKDLKKLKKELQKYYGAIAGYSKGMDCYIATAVYGSNDCYHVAVLRHFRDRVLINYCFSRYFVDIYYYCSPFFVKKFSGNRLFNMFFRIVLGRIVKIYSKYMEDFYV